MLASAANATMDFQSLAAKNRDPDKTGVATNFEFMRLGSVSAEGI
jgi:hypothetical protein